MDPQEFDEVPQSEIVIVSSRQYEGSAIRGECDGLKPRRLDIKSDSTLARRHSPEPESSVVPGGCQEQAIRGESDRIHGTGMPDEGPTHLPRIQVPEADMMVGGPGRS